MHIYECLALVVLIFIIFVWIFGLCPRFFAIQNAIDHRLEQIDIKNQILKKEKEILDLKIKIMKVDLELKNKELKDKK